MGEDIDQTTEYTSAKEVDGQLALDNGVIFTGHPGGLVLMGHTTNGTEVTITLNRQEVLDVTRYLGKLRPNLEESSIDLPMPPGGAIAISQLSETPQPIPNNTNVVDH